MALCNDRRCGCTFQVDDSAAIGITLAATGTGEAGDPYVITVTTNLATLLSDNIDGVTLLAPGGIVEVADGGLTAVKFAAEAWVDYNAGWAASLINPSIGNGVLEARYMKHGNTCWFSIHIVPGSTTNFGSGFFVLALPFAPYGSNTDIVKPFYGNIFSTSGASNTSVVLLVRQDNTVGNIFLANGTNSRIDGAGTESAIALSTDTSINITGTFETE